MSKNGFSYYNVDTDRYQDIRIKRLKKDHGCNGIAVYDYILCEIYRVRGCVLEWDENTAFDVAEYFGLKESQIVEIVNYCCAVGLFNKGLLTNGRVLTSESIQRRYMEMCRRSKRSDYEIPEKWVILPEETPKPPEETPKPPEETPKPPEEIDKVKKSRVKKRKTPPTPLKGECDERFVKFQKWMDENAPRVSKMKEPFTEKQFFSIRDKHSFQFIQEILDEMHNWKKLDERISASKTFQTFARKRL